MNEAPQPRAVGREPAQDAEAFEAAGRLAWMLSADGSGQPRVARSKTAVCIATLLDVARLPGWSATTHGLEPGPGIESGTGARVAWAGRVLRDHARLSRGTGPDTLSWVTAANLIYPQCWEIVAADCQDAGLTGPKPDRRWWQPQRAADPIPDESARGRVLSAERSSLGVNQEDAPTPVTPSQLSQACSPDQRNEQPERRVTSLRDALIALHITDVAARTLVLEPTSPMTATVVSLCEQARVQARMSQLLTRDPLYDALASVPWTAHGVVTIPGFGASTSG